MTAKPCFHRQITRPIAWSSKVHFRVSRVEWRHFRASKRQWEDIFPDHYATLDLRANASPGEIKKQFYKLSKSYHPDLHPNDPSASQRFVKISEAYAVLSATEKRALYDRDYQRVHNPSGVASSAAHPSGSFSSASTPAGSRPASGLSRRRTQFRGPPPSFYRSGGWGQYGEKRRASAANARTEDSGEHAETSGSSSSPGPGMGPGGFARGFDNDVLHFDHVGHYQTHSDIERTRHRARRKQGARANAADLHTDITGGGTGVVFNFLVISCVLGLVVSSGLLFSKAMVSVDPRQPPRRKNNNEEAKINGQSR